MHENEIRTEGFERYVPRIVTRRGRPPEFTGIGRESKRYDRMRPLLFGGEVQSDEYDRENDVESDRMHDTGNNEDA